MKRLERMPPIAHVTNHSLRRTFCSVLCEAGGSPAFVMNQMGHSGSSMALGDLRKEDGPQPGHRARMDELIRDAEHAEVGH